METEKKVYQIISRVGHKDFTDLLNTYSKNGWDIIPSTFDINKINGEIFFTIMVCKSIIDDKNEKGGVE